MEKKIGKDKTKQKKRSNNELEFDKFQQSLIGNESAKVDALNETEKKNHRREASVSGTQKIGVVQKVGKKIEVVQKVGKESDLSAAIEDRSQPEKRKREHISCKRNSSKTENTSLDNKDGETDSDSDVILIEPKPAEVIIVSDSSSDTEMAQKANKKKRICSNRGCKHHTVENPEWNGEFCSSYCAKSYSRRHVKAKKQKT